MGLSPSQLFFGRLIKSLLPIDEFLAILNNGDRIIFFFMERNGYMGKYNIHFLIRFRISSQLLIFQSHTKKTCLSPRKNSVFFTHLYMHTYMAVGSSCYSVRIRIIDLASKNAENCGKQLCSTRVSK